MSPNTAKHITGFESIVVFLSMMDACGPELFEERERNVMSKVGFYNLIYG